MVTYRITFDVNVNNEDALIAYARERFQECWFDTLDSIVSSNETLVERALLEALLFSNENPSPDEYGIEFGGEPTVTQKGATE